MYAKGGNLLGFDGLDLTNYQILVVLGPHIQFNSN